SSREVAARRPSKRLKCEKPGLEKSEPEGLTGGSGSLAALGETPETSHGDPRSEDPGDSNIFQQKKGGGTLETNEDNLEKEVNAPLKPGAVKSSSAPSKMDSDDSLHSHIGSEEESSGESVLADRGLTKEAVQPDNSAFLDEDSNQPMPVERFFGDCKFIQDLPAVVLPSTTMSRREFRKLHFIAKEDEEEEED
ncbi:CA174 protein, partial [Zapornia atra]|nr:CA174 protein [Zapornia atra]